MHSDAASLARVDLFEPVKGRRLSLLIAEQLQKAIFGGALPEGGRLPPERELAERFQASRTSVQEAIHMLELMGLISIRRGSSGGAFVTRPDFAKASGMLQAMLTARQFDMAELYQARLLIEPGIAEIAARVATPEDILALRAALNSGRDKTKRGERNSIGRNFHYLLACATGNELLVMLVSSLLGVAQTANVRHRLSSAHTREHAHERIVDAIERRDGETARRVASEHLTQMLQDVTKVSSERGS
jgi:DNA-binding FadR family transcriptional regulator